MINDILTLANTYLLGPGLTVAVLVCGFLLMLRLKPFVILHPKRSLAALTEKPADGLSPAKAMCVALAGTLGVGNIAGVASAIAVGGAGAIFWMWVSAFAAMPIKYAEIVLAVKHRRRDEADSKRYHGGAHFYISDLAELGLNKHIAKFLSILFATLCLATSLTMGCSVQSNAIAVSIGELTGLNPLVCAVPIAIIAFLIIAGGLKRISDMTIKLIPLMSAVYVVMSLYIVFTNIQLIGDIFANIISSAFNPTALGGGIIGFITNRTLAIGVTRGIVSNEAGCGTAPIAHASANVKSPAIQGIWGIVEVFVDTIIICSMTAFVVLIGEEHGISVAADGMAAAMNAFSCFIPFADVIISAAILVFAFCTIICWFYYGTESLGYLTKNLCVHKVYTLLYTVCIVLGSLASGGLVWSLADFTVSAMTAVNVVAVMLYVPEIKRETEMYFTVK